MESQPNFGSADFCATLKGQQVEFDHEHHDAAIVWLVKEAGGYDASLNIRPKTPSNLPPALQRTQDDPTDTVMDRAMREGRLTVDAQAAAASGFSLKDPIYALGRKVVDTGVENARSARLEYLQKPLVREACSKFAAQIAAEHRKDSQVSVAKIRMRDDGKLLVHANDGRVAPIQMSESAFDSFCNRTPIGGAAYLKSCWPSLRAHNVNQWMDRIGQYEEQKLQEFRAVKGNAKLADPEVEQIVLRCRSTTLGTREAFAIVSKTYQPFDCDLIARELFEAAPQDARGSIVYDGFNTRFEVLFHSDVKFEDYGCGEIFRAGVLIRTNDVGNGSIKVSAMVERNLCLNLIVLDTAEVQVGKLRHVGDGLAQKFELAFRDALQRIGHFREAWGYAREDKVVQAASVVAGEELQSLTARELLAGIAWAQMNRELVPVRGKKKEVLRQVLRAYDVEPNKGEQLTRADVVNVWTRYAHESAAQQDPWIEDDIQAAAGKMLGARGNTRALPYEKVPFEL